MNFFHQSENLGVLPSKREYPSGSPKQLILRLRRLSLKKIFVSKAELKYTNSKVVINLLVYNLQLKQLVEEINNRLISFLRSSQSPSDGASLDSDSLRPSSGGFLYIGGRLKLGYEKSPLRPHSFFKKSRGRGSLPPPPAGGCTSLGGGEALGGSTLIASKRSFRWAQAPIVGGVHQRGSTPPGIQEGEKLYSKDARFAPELAPPLVLSGQSLASSRVSPACS